MHPIVTKYLQRYAEPQTESVSCFPANRCYRHVAIMPAYQERSNAWQRFVHQFDEQHLLILVINQPLSEQDTSPQRLLSQHLLQTGCIHWCNNHIYLVEPFSGQAHVLIIHAFEPGLPDKQGVGLARKIGADIATSLIEQGHVSSPWIASLDADTTLPTNYFDIQAELPPNAVGAVYGVQHIHASCPMAYQATQLYEQSLRYYVQGLTFAGSPYNFMTIGSALLFRCDSYCHLRGFPKRAAGEDFYFLNKLIKIGQVCHLDECIIRIDARFSKRVPFGTGVAASQIHQLASDQAFMTYDYRIFYALKEIVSWLKTPTESGFVMDTLSPLNQEALRALNIQSLQTQPKQKIKQWQHQAFIWFDAFRTMKFIHYLTEHGYPKQPLSNMLQRAQQHF
jgi:hypothetical protein